MTNIPSRSMEDWWFATTTQASGLFNRSVSPLTFSIKNLGQARWFSCPYYITSQSSPRSPERGIINFAPSTALATLQGRASERGIIRKLMNVSHK